MRIVTRPDFDGIVCAALLFEVERITQPTQWVQPNDMQKGLIHIEPIDIIANLPYAKNCALWFDHHVTNELQKDFQGAFRVAPSAARVVFEYYQGRFNRDFGELVNNTDDIDSANLNTDQILRPENYPYILLSMTISGRTKEDADYWNNLVHLLRNQHIDEIMLNSEVIHRCNATVAQNKAFHGLLLKHTRLEGPVAITDFRSFQSAPDGNRFLAYSLFPDAIVSVKIRYHDADRQKVIISVGHSIINRNCQVNVGKMLSEFGGGGHDGAGACSVPLETANDVIRIIIDRLKLNSQV
jgi:hypothetical protein